MKPLPLLARYAAALLLTLAGCATTAVGTAREGSYTLRPGQQMEPASNTRLIYESFSDSRCPIGGTCIWAGELVYHFRLTSPRSTESFKLRPEDPAFVSTTLHGARIELDPASIPPAPRSDAKDLQPYPVTLKITAPKP